MLRKLSRFLALVVALVLIWRVYSVAFVVPGITLTRYVSEPTASSPLAPIIQASLTVVMFVVFETLRTSLVVNGILISQTKKDGAANPH